MPLVRWLMNSVHKMADVLQFPDKRVQAQLSGARVAVLEGGFTRIVNELYDVLIGANLTRNQAKVVHAVVRKTYGFNKSRDRISDSQLGNLTGLHRQKVNKAKNELITMGVLVMVCGEIGVNKVISDWKIPCHQNSDSVTKTVTGVSPKQGHTKDTIQKTKTENTSVVPATADSMLVMVEGAIGSIPALSPVSQLVKPVPPTTKRIHPTVPAISEESITIELLLNTGATYPVTAEFTAQMQALYPGVDLAQELRAMCGWLLANPTKRKTKAGITRFINSWLSRCQDRGSSSLANRSVHRVEEWDLTKTMNAEKLNNLLKELF